MSGLSARSVIYFSKVKVNDEHFCPEGQPAANSS